MLCLLFIEIRQEYALDSRNLFHIDKCLSYNAANLVKIAMQRGFRVQISIVQFL